MNGLTIGDDIHDALERLVIVGVRLVTVSRDVLDRMGVLAHLQHLRDLPIERRRIARAHAVVPAILTSLSQSGNVTDAHEWRAGEFLRRVSDLTILPTGPPGEPSRALIKIAETPQALERLQRQARVLDDLHRNDRLGDWRRLLPRLLDVGEIGHTPYFVEQRVNGESLKDTLDQPGSEIIAIREAAQAIAPLHCATTREVTTGEDLLERWLLGPVRELSGAVAGSRGPQSSLETLASLAKEFCSRLEGRQIAVSWVHGDFHPGNILSGHDGRITGIIDWESAHADGFPSLDLVTLLITVRMEVRRQEIGPVVCDLLGAEPFTEGEARVVASAPDSATWAAIGTDQLILMCWLRHVAEQAAIRRSMVMFNRRYTLANLWVYTNVRGVLDTLPGAAVGS